jgi:hypothetical protein
LFVKLKIVATVRPITITASRVAHTLVFVVIHAIIIYILLARSLIYNPRDATEAIQNDDPGGKTEVESNCSRAKIVSLSPLIAGNILNLFIL